MRKIKYLVPILAIVLFVLYRLLISDYSLGSGDFEFIYKHEAATIENYQKECTIEFDKNLHFPASKITKAVLISSFFSFDKELSQSSTNRIIEILNDSTSYEWGEICCFDSGRRIVFYDTKGSPVGITVFDDELENLTNSSPYLKKMKWAH